MLPSRVHSPSGRKARPGVGEGPYEAVPDGAHARPPSPRLLEGSMNKSTPWAAAQKTFLRLVDGLLGGFHQLLNKTAVNKGFPVFVAPVAMVWGQQRRRGFIFSLRAPSGPSGPSGRLFIDRFGPRWACLSGTDERGGFLALGYTTSLWAFGVILSAGGHHRDEPRLFPRPVHPGE